MLHFINFVFMVAKWLLEMAPVLNHQLNYNTKKEVEIVGRFPNAGEAPAKECDAKTLNVLTVD